MESSGGSLDSFVHVHMADVDDASIEKKDAGKNHVEAAKDGKTEENVASVDCGVVVQEIVPKEVQMQLLASAIDGEVCLS